MSHTLKNVSSIPLDIHTVGGTVILPINGTLENIELDGSMIAAYDASPYVELSEFVQPEPAAASPVGAGKVAEGSVGGAKEGATAPAAASGPDAKVTPAPAKVAEKKTEKK